VYQSSTRRQALPKTRRHLKVVVAGHLRDEKWPQTVFELARQLHPDEGICIDHIGHDLDPALGEMARATQELCPHYRWLGGLPHELTRRHLQRAHVLLHPSRMEGGAHVIMEAVLSGTPVLASRVAGNVGMLGTAYPGFFEPGRVDLLLALLRDGRRGQSSADGGLLLQLQAQCDARAPIFSPHAEREALWHALSDLL
jgi:glycosyltransferase involved in cell wall biosynthesis